MGTDGNDLKFIVWKPVFLGVGDQKEEYPDAPRLPVVQSCNDWTGNVFSSALLWGVSVLTH